jgi:hypothetical protein
MYLEIILILLLLWFMGIVNIPSLSFQNMTVLYFNGKPINLAAVFTFFIIIMVLGILPKPIKQIAAVLFIIWVLSTGGIITFVGISNLMVIGIITSLVFSVFKHVITSD